ncbi:MAG: hypothetical protein OIN66_16760 [Candidatus Methanoperedens sp.]|nr:hypothetical protein [Candidatus Methanoperedens sp.]
MDVDLEAIARKVDTLEDKVSKLEKTKAPYEFALEADRVKEAIREYLKSSGDIRNQWKGKLSAVEEVRAMRRHVRG